MRQQYHFRPGPDGLRAWDVRRLIELTADVPDEEVALAAITELHADYWYAHGEVPTVASISEHVALVLAADLTYPIVLDPDGGLMDGMHRVVRALAEGRETVTARRLPVLPDPDYVGVVPEDLPYDVDEPPRVSEVLASAAGTPALKYAVVERERRFLVARVPAGVARTSLITDRYLTGARLRLREVVAEDGTVVRKLGQKVRLTGGPQAVAGTNLYLDDAEWQVLAALAGPTLRKRRHLVQRDGWRFAVDEHEDGTLIAEFDDGPAPSGSVPDWLEVLREVTTEEAWTGAGLARRGPADGGLAARGLASPADS